MSNRQQPALPDGYLPMSDLSARVRLVRRLSDGDLVAVKGCAAAAGPDCADRLQREAELLGRLDHRNIVHRLDWLPPVLLTRYIAGTTLAQRYGGQPAVLPHAQLDALLAPLLSAIAAIHAAGYLHGDLSPHNILLRHDGEPLLLDLDSAIPLSAAAQPPAGKPTADPLGAQATAGFAPPERYRSDQPQREYSDLYSLAAIAYGLMTGHYPPTADKPGEWPALPRPAGDYPTAFVDAILSALAPDPTLRPATTAAFAAALGLSTADASGGPDPATRRSELPATEPIPRRPGGLPHPPVSPTTETDLPAQSGPETGAGAPPRGGGRLLPILLLVTLAIAGLYWGPGWYRAHLQMDWLVDPDGGGDTRTIGAALAVAPSGARIAIRPGTYTESLTVKRPVTLVADGPGALIRPPSGPCLRFLAGSGRIQGLDFATAATAAATEATPCIEIRGGSVLLEDNHISGRRGAALRLDGAGQATVGLNEITATGGAGIIIEGASAGVIASNHIHDTARSAIIVRGGATPELHCNQIESAGQAGILVEDGSRPQIESNRIQNSAASGIEVRSGARPLLRNNLIEMSQQAGLYLHSGAAPEVSDNQILDSGFSGIIVADGARPLLTGNTIGDGSEHGVLLLPTARVTLSDNDILDNQGNGLVIAAGARSRGDGNRVLGNRQPQTVDGR